MNVVELFWHLKHNQSEIYRFTAQQSVALGGAVQRQQHIGRFAVVLAEFEGVNFWFDLHLAIRAFQNQIIDHKRCGGLCFKY